MADRLDKETRSYIMSRIRGKNTKPEIVVRKFLHAEGFRFRINVKKLAGTPDIVLPKHKSIVNVHGCFWHGHNGCRHFKLPTTRQEWWEEKISRTKIRDKKNEEILSQAGWKVFTVYECQLKKEVIVNTLTNLMKQLQE